MTCQVLDLDISLSQGKFNTHFYEKTILPFYTKGPIFINNSLDKFH